MADSRLATKKGILSNKKTFEDHMWDFTKYGYTLVSLILGYDLGLFDILRKATMPLTSFEVAEKADLKERYVREWLGAVTAAQVIQVEDKDGTPRYQLPKEHYDVVMSSVGLGRGISGCIGRFNVIKNCFKKQGPQGDPHAFDGDFWSFFGQFREHDSTKTLEHEVFPNVATIDGLREKLNDGCRVLDIGCGNGTNTRRFAERYPQSFFLGIDISEDALKEAAATSNAALNVEYKYCNFNDPNINLNETFDVVVLLQVLHNLPDPIGIIKSVQKLLKTSGYLLLQEMQIHSNHVDNVGDLAAARDYTFSTFYCLSLSMSKAPHIGYGNGWGSEDMLKALSKYFTLVARFPQSNNEVLYCLSKD